MTSWQIIESGRMAPQAIMDKDSMLLAQLDPEGPSLIHFYEWDAPCLTYGYFADPARYLDLQALEENGLQKARRPTGGGVIFHLSDLAFSVLIPAKHRCFSLNTLDNYALINQKVAEAIAFFTSQSLQPELLKQENECDECLGFCMAKPTQYDLIIQGRKVGGAAQRRTKQGFLHQATLSLLFPPTDLLAKVLKKQESVLHAMKERTYCLLSPETTTQELEEKRKEIQNILKFFLCSLH